MGKDCWFPSPSNLPQSLIHTSMDPREMRGCPWRKQAVCCSWLPFSQPLWDHCPSGEPWAPSLLCRARKASCMWKPEKHSVHFWQVQLGSVQAKHHCPLQTHSSSLNSFHQWYKGNVCKDCLSPATRSRFTRDKTIYLDFKGLDRAQAPGYNTWKMHQLLPSFTDQGVFGELMR